MNLNLIDLPPPFMWALFSISLVGICSIFGLAFAAYILKDFQFFPPPTKSSWQHVAFRSLFRIFLYPLLALSIALLGDQSSSSLASVFGIVMVLAGFGLAFRITFFMGWKDAFGEPTGLRTDGWFRHSRNPVYVSTWIGLLGWGLLIPEPFICILLSLWGALYLIAPIFEEPWLEREYGQAYSTYKAATPRFFAGF